MPSQEIEEIRARHEAATKGPYRYDGKTIVDMEDTEIVWGHGEEIDGNREDVRALAASWADRATLLAEVDRLKNAVAYAEDALHGSYCVCDTSVKCAPCEVRDTLGEVLDGKSVPE